MNAVEIFCKKHGLTVNQFYGKEKYDGDFDLRYETKLPKGASFYVTGYIDLSSLTTLPEGVTLTAGGYLYLRSLTTLPEGVTLTAGGYLDLKNKTVRLNNVQWPLIWPDGKHICADGIMQEIISQKGKVYHTCDIVTKKPGYLVTDGHGKFSHGETLKEAKESLIYKISNRDKSKYENMTRKTSLSFADMVECYRVISGACEAGTRGFVATLGEKRKDAYTIGEVIKLTVGQWGNKEFFEFFRK